jgi:hypothetical protein
MVPAFGLLTWLVIWSRQRELRTVREELPGYAAAGWLTPAEPFALGSLRARRLARDYAGRHLGTSGARAVAEYEAYATSLAFLRRRGRLGRAGADFVAREQALLHEMWRRREVAQPALDHAARMTAPPVRVAAPPWPVYGVYGQSQRYPHTPPAGQPHPFPGPAAPVTGPTAAPQGPAAPPAAPGPQGPAGPYGPWHGHDPRAPHQP